MIESSAAYTFTERPGACKQASFSASFSKLPLQTRTCVIIPASTLARKSASRQPYAPTKGIRANK